MGADSSSMGLYERRAATAFTAGTSVSPGCTLLSSGDQGEEG